MRLRTHWLSRLTFVRGGLILRLKCRERNECSEGGSLERINIALSLPLFNSAHPIIIVNESGTGITAVSSITFLE
jgi:hypothetical protein